VPAAGYLAHVLTPARTLGTLALRGTGTAREYAVKPRVSRAGSSVPRAGIGGLHVGCLSVGRFAFKVNLRALRRPVST